LGSDLADIYMTAMILTNGMGIQGAAISINIYDQLNICDGWEVGHLTTSFILN